MGRTMRERKEVDYSDPGALTLADIRRGSVGGGEVAPTSPQPSPDKAKVAGEKPARKRKEASKGQGQDQAKLPAKKSAKLIAASTKSSAKESGEAPTAAQLEALPEAPPREGKSAAVASEAAGKPSKNAATQAAKTAAEGVAKQRTGSPQAGNAATAGEPKEIKVKHKKREKKKSNPPQSASHRPKSSSPSLPPPKKSKPRVAAAAARKSISKDAAAAMEEEPKGGSAASTKRTTDRDRSAGEGSGQGSDGDHQADAPTTMPTGGRGRKKRGAPTREARSSPGSPASPAAANSRRKMVSAAVVSSLQAPAQPKATRVMKGTKGTKGQGSAASGTAGIDGATTATTPASSRRNRRRRDRGIGDRGQDEEEEETPTPPQYANQREVGNTRAAEDVGVGSPSRTAIGKRVSKKRGLGEAGAPSPDGDDGSDSSGGRNGSPGAGRASPKQTPSKRRRTTLNNPSPPGSGRSAARSPRSTLPLISPNTPGATEAQQIFLSQMQDLFGAVGAASDASGGASGGVRGDTAGTEAGMRDWPGEVAYWKERFEKLHAIRETVPEEELKLFREHAQERDQAAQEYISHLREEANEARATATAAAVAATAAAAAVAPPSPRNPGAPAPTTPSGVVNTQDVATDDSTPTNSAYVRSLEGKLEYHRKVIGLYQSLSSLAIHPKRRRRGDERALEDEQTVTCTAVNHLHRRAVRFDLTIPEGEEEDFAYRATGNAHVLPGYMQHELLFSKKQCPLFLTKLLQNLFRT